MEDSRPVGTGHKIVSFVTLFDEMRVTAVIEASKPDVYVKGGDYTVETLDPGERGALIACGAEIVIMPTVPGVSTTDIIARILRAESADS